MLAAFAILAGCAPALREPPTLDEMAGQPAAVDDVAGLPARADALWNERSLASVSAAERLYLQAATAEPQRIEGLTGAARAGVWLANHEAEPDARERAATAAVHAAQWCDRRRPGEAACQYWLAVALGVQARERRATAIDALPRIVELLELAAEGDPELEEAGPHRVLALVLLRAPGWPTGPGDPDLGLEQARLAAALRPDHPPNQLCLGEALGATGDREGSRRAYERALSLARPLAASGNPDAGEWIEEAERALEKR
jgi:tetratricopeptide (TPR) repeat protein